MADLGPVGRISSRVQLRAFQHARAAMSPGDLADLEALQHKDLDLSIKAGALLAFDGLLATLAINPITASPGAPVSIDAVKAPMIVTLVMIAVGLVLVAGFYAIRAIMVGETIDEHGLEDNPKALIQRIMATYCTALDAQARFVGLAIRFTVIGGAVSGLGLLASVVEKWV